MISEQELTGNAVEIVSISRVEYDKLNDKLKSLTEENDGLNKKLKLRTEENAELTQKVEWLMERLRLANKKIFGASSEQIKAEENGQMSLFGEVIPVAGEENQEPIQVAEHTRVPRKAAGAHKALLPDNLPVEKVKHDLPEDKKVCPKCGTAMGEIGQQTRRTLVIIPAQVKIREDIYPTYACKSCEKHGTETPVVKTPKNGAVIPGSFASPEAVAYIMTQKFLMDSPLYRLSMEFHFMGIRLSRQTMCSWLLKASKNWLEPLFTELHKELLTLDILHADETELQVLREPGKKPQSKSYIWLYRSGWTAAHQIVLYEYQPDRKADHPIAFLKGYSGFLQTDGYQAYKMLVCVILVGCLGHGRRKFYRAIEALPKNLQKDCTARIGLDYFDRLFQIEREIANLPPSGRFQQRIEHSKPILDELWRWANSVKAAPKSSLGTAIQYLQNQWPYFLNYLKDGRLEATNNRAERSIRPFVLSRKNFLFANTPAGAKGSAVIFSLIETARENGLDPYRYLTWVFQTAPNLDLKRRDLVQSLLPWNAPQTCKAGSWIGEK